MFALADKIQAGDIKKHTKQKLHLQNTIMDFVWMTQNFGSVIALCFGPSLNSATFLQNWACHMYENCLMYSSLQASNSYFFARGLFTIDNILQIHQQSCSNTKDHLSINDLILLMEDTLS